MTELHPMDIDRSSVFTRERYMALRGAKETYAQIERTAPFKELLEEFGKLLNTAVGAEDLGVFLLHRHYAFGPGSIPLERRIPWGESGEYALVTRATSDYLHQKLAPSRWQYTPQSRLFEALEYSTDPLVVDRWASLSSSPEVPAAAARILEDSELWPFLGLTIASRSSLPKRTGEVYLETSDSKAMASVVRVQTRGNSTGKGQIPTVWVPITSCWCAEGMKCDAACIEEGSEEGCSVVEHCEVPSGEHHVVPCV
jgi:hypothetical protein